jgi:hypothetical protein
MIRLAIVGAAYIKISDFPVLGEMVQGCMQCAICVHACTQTCVYMTESECVVCLCEFVGSVDIHVWECIRIYFWRGDRECSLNLFPFPTPAIIVLSHTMFCCLIHIYI